MYLRAASFIIWPEKPLRGCRGIPYKKYGYPSLVIRQFLVYDQYMTKMNYIEAMAVVNGIVDPIVESNPKFGYARALGTVESLLARLMTHMDSQDVMDLLDDEITQSQTLPGVR